MDLGLGDLPIGDILKQQHAAAFRHRIDGDGEHALMLGVDENFAVSTTRQSALKRQRQTFCALA